uniref:Uncharacterized protein n=1 Tax=Arundo donax TaxID=35708 RepID=A0A0A9D5A3_ARUDO
MDSWNQSKKSVCIKQGTTRHGCCPEKIQKCTNGCKCIVNDVNSHPISTSNPYKGVQASVLILFWLYGLDKKNMFLFQ